MKKIILILFELMLATSFAFSQFNLDIRITDIRNNTGNIMLQLYDEKEIVVTQEMGKIADNTCSLNIKNLKAGKYAVRYFHDENLNCKLDTDFVGKPTEGYGFSNNVNGKFGPPPFEKWLFEINGNKKIDLKPTY